MQASEKNIPSITKSEKNFFRQLVVKGEQPGEVLYVHIIVQNRRFRLLVSLQKYPQLY